MDLTDVLLTGTRAAQPSATVVPIGALYAVTDEGTVDQSDGSAWVEYLSGVTIGSVVSLHPFLLMGA